MTCDGCAKDITDALYKLPGINKVEANVKDQLVSIEGTGLYSLLPRLVCFLFAPHGIVAAKRDSHRTVPG
jgi:copper chaperone CopZ